MTVLEKISNKIEKLDLNSKISLEDLLKYIEQTVGEADEKEVRETLIAMIADHVLKDLVAPIMYFKGMFEDDSEES